MGAQREQTTVRWRTLAVFGLLYVAALWVGIQTTPVDGQLALAWPVAGVGVWFLDSLRGRRERGLAVLVVVLATFVLDVRIGMDPTAALCFGGVNAVHAVVGAVLLRRLLPRTTGLVEPVHVALLLVVSFTTSLGTGLLSAVVASGLMGEPFANVLLLFVVRNGGTMFVVLATVLALSPPHSRRDLLARHRVLELLLIGVVSIGVHLVVFAAPGELPLLYLATATSVWAGTRLGVARTGALALVACVLAVSLTVTGYGALAQVGDEQLRAVLVQSFTVVVVVVSLSLATLQQARDELARRLASALARSRASTEFALIGKAVVVRGAEGGWSLEEANPALVALLGRDPVGARWRDLLHPEDRAPVRSALEAMDGDGDPTWEGEVRHRLPGGRQVWTQLHLSRLPYDGGGTGVVAQFLDVTARRAAQDDLEQLAHHDGLTGLLNRSRLLTGLRSLLAAPGERRPAVLFLDLDRFKGVNDTYGHEAGDQVLIQVATALQASSRPGDLVARIGGDEFLVCCPGVGDDACADALARRLEAAVRPALLVAGHDVGLDVSVGVRLVAAGESAEEAVRGADLAMYAVKRGRRRLVPQPRG